MAAVTVGCRALDVVDEVQGARVPVHVLYPARAAPQIARFGAYELEVAIDAAVAAQELPLVAISHGTGGTPWGYAGLATHLARAGFAVALIEHTGNSRNDNSLGESPAMLANRPRHVRRALDAVFAALRDHVVAGRAAVIGHSFGGYTALAVAGGTPMVLPEQSPDGVARPLEVEHDARVRACVLLAPALPWLLAPGALAGVRVPVLARAGEHDAVTPPFFIERVLRGLPGEARLDYAVVPGAGHFAWFGPVPRALAAQPAFAPGQDPPGFDRAAYQRAFAGECEAFLRATLSG